MKRIFFLLAVLLVSANALAQSGNAVYLNGTTDYVQVADNAALRPVNLTLEAWVNFASINPSFNMIAGKPYNGSSSEQNSYQIWVQSGQLNAGINAFSVGSAIGQSFTPVLGQWYHVAMTYNDTTKIEILYLNGSLIATGVATTPLYDSGNLLIGTDINIGSVGGFVNGKIDEVRLWNVSRTQTQIQSTMNTTLAGNESGLVAYYKLDESGRGAGNTVQNSATATGSALNGTTVGTIYTPFFSPLVYPSLANRIVYSREDRTIWLSKGDGSADSLITTGSRPRVSPDGRYLLFRRSTQANDDYLNSLYVLDTQTGNESLVYTNNDYVVYYDWTPSGDSILFDYQCSIYKMKRDGTGVANFLSGSDCYDDAPSVRTADSKVAFYNANQGLLTASSNGTGRLLIPNTKAGDYWPSWSPDGNWIAFERTANGSTPNRSSYFKIKPDGSSLTQLTSIAVGDTLIRMARWTADGKWLVVAGKVGGVWGLHLISTDGSGNITRISTTSGSHPDFIGSLVGTPPIVTPPAVSPPSGIPSAGLRLWLRADDIQLSNGSFISEWRDTSGLGYHFTSSGTSRPRYMSNGNAAVINGKPYVSYEVGSNLYLGRIDLLGIGANTPRTLIAVYRMLDPAQRAFALQQGDYSTNFVFFGTDGNTYITQGNRFGIYATNSSYDTQTPTDTLYKIHFLAAKTMTVGTTIASDVEYRINDTLQTLSIRSGSGTFLSFATANEMRLNGNVNYAEVIVYNRALDSTDRAAVTTYLRNKYATAQNPLPVELTSFTGKAASGNVQLNWTTATEKNNAGFDVERSSDKTTFSKLGFVKGNGTTTQSQSYSFTDNTASGNVFYRLKQTDYDGKYEYSRTVEVQAATPKVFALSQNYPNPFNPVTVIRYQLPISSQTTLKVYDVLGREVVTLINERKAAGSYAVDFDASKLTSGIYFYRLQSNGYTQTKKMLFIK